MRSATQRLLQTAAGEDELCRDSLVYDYLNYSDSALDDFADSAIRETAAMRRRLETAGWMIDYEEGTPFAYRKPGWLTRRLRTVLSPAYVEYFRINDAELREGFEEDAGLIITPKRICARMAAWENFLAAHPGFVETEHARRWVDRQFSVLLSGTENTGVSAGPGNEVDQPFREAYNSFLKNNRKSAHYGEFKEYYALLQADRFHVSKASNAWLQAHHYDPVELWDDTEAVTHPSSKKAAPAGVTSQAPRTFTDARDGHVYRTVKIGRQTWMAENLALVTALSWGRDSEYVRTYGRLYSWKAAKSACHAGWHLPSDAEWDTLMEAVGGFDSAGVMLKSNTGWDKNNGRDRYHFAVLPAGFHRQPDEYARIGSVAYFWASSVTGTPYVWSRLFSGEMPNAYRCLDSSVLGYSVRCVKD